MTPIFERETRYWMTDSLDSHALDLFQAGPPPIAARRNKGLAFLSRMPIKVGDKLLLLSLCDVLWIQSKGNWICLHSHAADYDFRTTLASFHMQLDPNSFLRIHRNAIVNLNHVVEFKLPRTGNAFAHLRNGKILPISRTGRSTLRQFLQSSSRID